jgi:predicted TIM-barrel fold metal-dependent hydrolase
MSEAEAALCLAPKPLRNRGDLRLPSGTCDSHFHVFAPGAPLTNPRSYTPRMETLAGWLALADRFGIARGVLVQPSVYGLDNTVLLDALAHAPDRLRGVVVIAADTPMSEIARLDELGVRGVRINLRNKGGLGVDALAELAPRIRTFGWHVQFQVGPDAIGMVARLCEQYDIAGVIDHLAFMALDATGTALEDLRRGLDSGRVFTKISAPYRLEDNSSGDGYRSVVEKLARDHADRLVWGSDWPHTELFDTMPEDDDLVALSLAAVPAQSRDQVFTQTARRLYWSH